MPSPDAFEFSKVGLSDIVSNLALVTPSNTVDLANYARVIWVGTPGTLKVTTITGQTITIPASIVQVCPILGIRVKRIWADSTASDIMTGY